MDELTVLMEQLEESWKRLGKPGRVLAAVSGGADSMALLSSLYTLAKDQKLSLMTVHVDHGLRKDSWKDACFVQDFCQSRTIPCRVIRVQVNGSSEEAARKKRYEALFQAYRDSRAEALVLAHHQRDQAETILLHLLRGSGAKGLSGMQESVKRAMPGGGNAILWRPFLTVEPQMLRSYLASQEIGWREDETNRDAGYLRNFLRLKILPLIRERLPEAEKALSQAALVLRDEDAYIQSQAEAFLAEHACLHPPCRWIDAIAWRREQTAMQRRILRLASPVELSFDKTEEVLSSQPGCVTNLPQGWRTLETGRFLHFLCPKREEEPLAPYRVLPFNGYYGNGKREQAMPERLLSLPLEIRRRKPGDVIHPLGAAGEKSLQDYLVDRKVDRPFRDHLPLLCHDKKVLWVIGVGASEEMRVDQTEKAALLRYEGYLPGEIENKGEDDHGQSSRTV